MRCVDVSLIAALGCGPRNRTCRLLPGTTCRILGVGIPLSHQFAMSEDGAGRWQRYGPPASSFSGDFGRRMPRAPEPIWEPSANASREKHATPRVKELLTARWDAPPGNADEFRHEKIEELFKADPDRVIRPAELAAVVVFAPGESVWGTFTTEDAAALFKAIEAHSAVRG